MVEYFFSRCFPEPHSTKQLEDCVGWGLETTPQVLIAAAAGLRSPTRRPSLDWCGRVRRPSLVINGDDDEINPLPNGEAVARATGGRLVVLGGAGHIPVARDPVRLNLLIAEFAGSLPAPEPR